MSPEEHLSRIAAKCRELLAIAEKRTQGEWNPYQNKWDESWSVSGSDPVAYFSYLREEDHSTIPVENDENNAQFIANCAGPSEAGWRATISAIKSLTTIASYAEGGTTVDSTFDEPRAALEARFALQQIIAAWPEELL